MLNYTAIDFETANSYRGSPCAVGLVRVRGGVPVAEQHWLIKPPARVDFFNRWNSIIHGVTAEMVKDQPRWKEVLPAIIAFIGDDVVVAHNAAFDIGVIRYACAADNIEWPGLKFLCTMVLSRRALALPTYRLPYVSEFLGGSLKDHHNPLADARAVVGVVRGIAAIRGDNCDSLDELAARVGIRIGRMSSGIYKGSTAISPGSYSRLHQQDPNPNADPDSYLYGRVVVFTGTLFSMTRQIAWEECSRIGAVAEGNTTKRTNVLVVGDINPTVLRPGSEVTGRTRRAFELQEQGQEIEVMTEDDFLRCVDGKPLDGPEVLLSDDHSTPSQTSGSVPARLRKVSPAVRKSGSRQSG